jgi:hypothetical protein
VRRLRAVKKTRRTELAVSSTGGSLLVSAGSQLSEPFKMSDVCRAALESNKLQAKSHDGQSAAQQCLDSVRVRVTNGLNLCTT